MIITLTITSQIPRIHYFNGFVRKSLNTPHTDSLMFLTTELSATYLLAAFLRLAAYPISYGHSFSASAHNVWMLWEVADSRCATRLNITRQYLLYSYLVLLCIQRCKDTNKRVKNQISSLISFPTGVQTSKLGVFEFFRVMPPIVTGNGVSSRRR